MTSKAHALSREELIRTLTAYSGVTTADGAGDGTTLIDSNLIDRNDFISEKTILILSGDAKDEDKGALSFNNVTGAITLRGTGVSAQIVSGTIFRVLNISSVEVDVAAIQEDLGDMADAATSDDLSDITTTSALAKLRRILVRFSSGAFSASIDGSARTDLDALYTALGVLLGTRNATATADDLSDITTTSALAKLRRLLLRFSSGAFSVSIDGSARTDLDALYTALGVLLGTRDATVSAGVLADTESALALLRRIATAGPVMLFGDITGYTDVNNFVVADFIGWEDDFFKGWYGYLVRDDGGAGAIPQGSRVTVTGYTSTTGALVTTALSAAGAVGDQIMLVHPLLMDAWNLRGGVDGVAEVREDQAAELDLAEYGTKSVTCDGSEQTLYEVTGVSYPYFVAGGFMDFTGANAGGGEDTTIKGYIKVDGTNYRMFYQETLLAVAVPVPAAVAFPRPNSSHNVPMGFYARQDVKFTIQQAAEGGGYNTLEYSIIDAQRGS